MDDWLSLDDVVKQYTKSSHHRQYSYRLVFGQLLCVNISGLPLGASVFTQLAMEAQLNCMCNYLLEFLYFGSLSLLAWVITGTGIQRCLLRYWHFGTLVQYQYGHIPFPVLALNIAHTGNAISALRFHNGMYRHSAGIQKCPLGLLANLK